MNVESLDSLPRLEVLDDLISEGVEVFSESIDRIDADIVLLRERAVSSILRPNVFENVEEDLVWISSLSCDR